MNRTALDQAPLHDALIAWSLAFLIFASINAGVWALS
jgi:hypothetical protein